MNTFGIQTRVEPNAGSKTVITIEEFDGLISNPKPNDIVLVDITIPVLLVEEFVIWLDSLRRRSITAWSAGYKSMGAKPSDKTVNNRVELPATEVGLVLRKGLARVELYLARHQIDAVQQWFEGAENFVVSGNTHTVRRRPLLL